VLEAVKSALKAVGLLDRASRALRKAQASEGVAIQMSRPGSWALAALRGAQSRGLAPWPALVPADRFLATCGLAIRTLEEAGHEFGDYLEFGVSRGTSLACMHTALREAGLGHVRLIGFDSFEGMPEESIGQGWTPGAYSSTLPATTAYLRKKGVDMSKVELVPGWFKDTCTPATAERLAIRRASVIMIDCDIYTASCEALAFCAPLIADTAVIIFDDWGWREEKQAIGQKEAFAEFLAANPRLAATPLQPVYLPQARIFRVDSRDYSTVTDLARLRG
jgi:hypothetical protein